MKGSHGISKEAYQYLMKKAEPIVYSPDFPPDKFITMWSYNGKSDWYVIAYEGLQTFKVFNCQVTNIILRLI